MHTLQELDTELCNLCHMLERKTQIQEAILTRLAQVEIKFNHLDELPEFGRIDTSIAKLADRLETVEAELTDLQILLTQTRNDAYDLANHVDRIDRR